jgi:hypothetical protein
VNRSNQQAAVRGSGWFSLALVATLASAGSTSYGAIGPTWEAVFQGTGPDDWVYVVHATSRDSWFLGGKWGVAKGNKAGIVREATPGRAVLGLFFEGADSLYALGRDELILHFDGKKWVEEHVGPKPKRPGRGADTLYMAYYGNPSSNAPIVAIGPSLVLVRQSNGTWKDPPGADRERLLEVGQLGPKITRPAKCDAAGWRWLGRSIGAFFCHDRRTFIFDSGTLTAKGKMPERCEATINSIVYAKGEIYASCGAATLWKTEGQTWGQVPPPKELKEIPSISVADDCLFVAGGHGVWRSCAK